MRSYKVLTLIALLFCSYSIQCLGETLTFRPNRHDGVDMWYSSYYTYNGSHFVDDSKLQVGGWGDNYWTLIKFDLGCLPRSATRVRLYLMPYNRGDSSTPVTMNARILTKAWTETGGWGGTLTGISGGTMAAPTPGTWYILDITSVYNAWQSGAYENHGLVFTPTSINNRFNVFRSSDFSDESHRPRIVIDYTPNTNESFSLCFPLKRPEDSPYESEVSAVMDHRLGVSGEVEAYNGEVGSINPVTSEGVVGYQKEDESDFNLAFNYCEQISSQTCGQQWLFYDGHTGYDYPASTGVPVYATAGGTTRVIDNSYNELVIDHGNGYATHYLHMSAILIGNDQEVQRGQLVGRVGAVGADGPHLHVTIKRNGVRVDPYGRAGVNGVLWDE